MDLPEGIDYAELAAIAEAELARRSLVEWSRYTNPAYQVAAIHKRLCEALERVERGECKRLAVFMPPRMGKTQAVSINFPAWFLGRNPDLKVVIASYGASLAQENSRQARDLLVSHGPSVFQVAVNTKSSAVDQWSIAGYRGGLVAGGVDGPLTGKGADLAIIDDPVKDMSDALSETQRESKKNWYRAVLRTRLHPGARVVLLQTRWHTDDLAGWLLDEAAKGGEQWEVLSFPMVADDGSLLWPERYDRAEVEAIRQSVGSVVWESLYQQNPLPADGGMFKRDWWRYWEGPLPGCPTLLQSWDMSFKGTQDSDYVVGQVWGKSGASYYLLDQVRGQWDAAQTITQLKALSAKWPQATLKLVEDAANGPAIISMLRGQVEGLVAVKPDGGKEARAHAVLPMIEAGNVFLPKAAPWVDGLLAECSAFPKGKNDDQVDALSQALNRLRRMSSEVTRPKSVPQERGMM